MAKGLSNRDYWQVLDEELEELNIYIFKNTTKKQINKNIIDRANKVGVLVENKLQTATFVSDELSKLGFKKAKKVTKFSKAVNEWLVEKFMEKVDEILGAY